jgi:hypothetical protein
MNQLLTANDPGGGHDGGHASRAASRRSDVLQLWGTGAFVPRVQETPHPEPVAATTTCRFLGAAQWA